MNKKRFILFCCLLTLAFIFTGGCQPDRATDADVSPESTAIDNAGEGSSQPSADNLSVKVASKASSTQGPTPNGNVNEPQSSVGKLVGGKSTSSAQSATGQSQSSATTGKPITNQASTPAMDAADVDNQAAKPSSKPMTENEVKLSIIGDEEHGTILVTTAVVISKGDSVLDILKNVTRIHKIQMEFRGSGATAYVEGIDNLYELDQGPESGWIYKINGKFETKSADSYHVENGDLIEWVYTLERD